MAFLLRYCITRLSYRRKDESWTAFQRLVPGCSWHHLLVGEHGKRIEREGGQDLKSKDFGAAAAAAAFCFFLACYLSAYQASMSYVLLQMSSGIPPLPPVPIFFHQTCIANELYLGPNT